MATIQIRDIPDDVYDEIRRAAQAAGQSLQAYMREQVIQQTRSRARRSAVLAQLDELIARDGGSRVTTEQILADLDEDRRR